MSDEKTCFKIIYYIEQFWQELFFVLHIYLPIYNNEKTIINKQKNELSPSYINLNNPMYMEIDENFCASLENMKDIYNYEEPYDNVVLTGLVGLYEITFEQSWKMMKEIM